MKIAFTYNLRLREGEEEAEFDTAETVDAIHSALVAGGHEVERVEVSGPASHLAARLEACAPDLIFNTAEGRRGRVREAFYPALFEELGFPYTGSDAYALTLTLDKHLTKLVLGPHGIDSPRGKLVTAGEFARLGEAAGAGIPLPCIVKPNYEGSSKGIGEDSVARESKQLGKILQRAVDTYPAGVIVEEYIPGVDITVPFLEGAGDDGVLTPVEYLIAADARNKYNLYDYRLKNQLADKVDVRCPADLPRDVLARLRQLAKTVFRVLGIRDLGRIDFRLGEDGRIYFLEINALPSLETGAGLFAAAARDGIDYERVFETVIESAARRWNIPMPAATLPRRTKPKEGLRVGFAFNRKRVESKDGNDIEAEYDSPATIEAVQRAIESFGHTVVPLEATSDFPLALSEARVELVFNMAEGLVGRNREAVVPALCELVGIPYTGSDSATLAIALDKALTKKVLRQHEIRTPEFQLMQTGREKLSAQLRFPLIVKPNQEGTSKGISSGSSVFDDEAGLRRAVREIIERYRQPALVEEYIPGREFTVGLLGDRRPRVLPPMEIRFKDAANPRPVYDYAIKQDFAKHVEYVCPPKLSTSEARQLERAARETFLALDCRDVARVDLRMNPQGDVYVLEVNPLPGLTPDYSDLVLIAQAAGMDHRTLIGEILAGGIKRQREKRRSEIRELGARSAANSTA